MSFSWILRPLATASAIAVAALGVASRKYEKARLYWHLGLYVGTLGLLSVWGVVVSVLATAAGQRLNINYFVARSFYLTCNPLVGVQFEVEGEEHLTNLISPEQGKGQPAVLIGNHQSFFDILYLGRIFPKRAAIMAKQELKWSPLLGQYLALSGAVFVDRKNREDARRALERAGDDMKRKGISLWVFPEGTRTLSAEQNLLPFKKGAFHLAIQAKVPIVAVVCENYHRLFDGRTRMESGTLRIRVLPPISTEGLGPDDVNSLTESTRDMMLKALREISSSTSSTPRSLESAQAKSTEETEDAQTPRAMSEEPRYGLRSRTSGTPLRGVESEKAKARAESSRETTEDEMEGDAVLLRRPKGQ